MVECGNHKEIQIMHQAATEALDTLCMRWKQASLEYFHNAHVPAKGRARPVEVQDKSGHVLRYAQVGAIETLGGRLAKDGGTRHSQEHRERVAEIVFFKHRRLLEGKEHMAKAKLTALVKTAGSSRDVLTGTVHVTRSTLVEMKRSQNGLREERRAGSGAKRKHTNR
ncbi:hypothetical protein N9L19_00255 [bacterium]|nr:hypothetical protein [bacterium]